MGRDLKEAVEVRGSSTGIGRCRVRCWGVQVLLELDAAPAVPGVSFTDGPDFSCGPVPLVPPVPAAIEKATAAAATAAV